VSKNDIREVESTPRKRAKPEADLPRAPMSQRAREVVGLALAGFALFAMLSLATFRLAGLDGTIPSGGLQNLCGAVGYYLAHGFARSLGFAGWVPFAMLFAAAVGLFVGKPLTRPTIKALGAVVFAAMLAILLAGADGQVGRTAATPFGAGGVFGVVVSPRLEAGFGGTGRVLIVLFGAAMGLMIATEWLFSQLVARTAAAIDALFRRVLRRPAVAGHSSALADDEGEEMTARKRRKPVAAVVADAGEAGEGAVADDDAPAKPARARRAEDAADGANEVDDIAARAKAAADAEDDGEIAVVGRAGKDKGAAKDGEAKARAELDAPVEPPKVEPPVAPAEPPKPMIVLQPKPRPKPRPKPVAQNLPFEEYPFPPVELFQEPGDQDASIADSILKHNSQAIIEKLANFEIEAEVVAASVGPAVTQYELRLGADIRVNKIASFESDLAAALKAVSVRVVAPIPGKDTVGIEVPNAERQKVYMRELLDTFGRSEENAIPLYLGKDVAGNAIVEDLAKMPHLLIAGTTGSGKSVCINTILLSILMTRTPEQVKLILVDPKMVELMSYKKVPHLCCDVVTNMKKAAGVLQWAVDEMENRYALLAAASVTHIRNYNRLGAQELEKRLQREPDPERVKLPYVVIVIDEFADLMSVAQNEVEEHIQRLAQKSRAVGMHVILATQRPSSEVITGIIKSNLPTQICFRVARKLDSRIVIDANGAEKLLGHGDMLYMPPGGGAMLRAQGAFVTDEEKDKVVAFLEDKGQSPRFTPELVQTQSSSRPKIADREDKYVEAVKVVLQSQRGSATLLQRALAVGYTRATRLLELMEEDGLVGPFAGSKSRDVLMSWEEYEAREAAIAEAEDAEADADGVAATDEPTEADAAAGPADAAAAAAPATVASDEDEVPFLPDAKVAAE